MPLNACFPHHKIFHCVQESNSNIVQLLMINALTHASGCCIWNKYWSEISTSFEEICPSKRIGRIVSPSSSWEVKVTRARHRGSAIAEIHMNSHEAMRPWRLDGGGALVSCGVGRWRIFRKNVTDCSPPCNFWNRHPSRGDLWTTQCCFEQWEYRSVRQSLLHKVFYWLRKMAF